MYLYSYTYFNYIVSLYSPTHDEADPPLGAPLCEIDVLGSHRVRTGHSRWETRPNIYTLWLIKRSGMHDRRSTHVYSTCSA